jgi:outer membrane protein assembly factor BamB
MRRRRELAQSAAPPPQYVARAGLRPSCRSPGARHWSLSLASAAFMLLAAGAARADDWPQWRGPQRDGVWRETGLVERFVAPELPLVWRAPVSAGYSGPTVAEGRVFVMDRQDMPQQVERVLAFAAADGKPLWTHTYECAYEDVGYTAGPRASVTIDGARAYAVGTMGHVHCLDVATGDVLWRHDGRAEYEIEMPIWGIASSPLVFQDLVIVQLGGAKGACLVAFHKATGAERWRALDERASYSSPILMEQAGRQVVVCWTGDSVTALEPETGKTFWAHPFQPTRMVINIATPVVDRHRIFLSSFYDGSLLLAVEPDRFAVRELWRRLGPDEQHTDSLHSIISTPRLEGDHIYGVDSYGELRCLLAATGDRVWESDQATPRERWGTIHMVQNGDQTWMLNERGELIIARLTPEGFSELSRARLLSPTTEQLRRRDGVVWAHPAYANRCIFARNDNELVCASLAAP